MYTAFEEQVLVLLLGKVLSVETFDVIVYLLSVLDTETFEYSLVLPSFIVIVFELSVLSDEEAAALIISAAAITIERASIVPRGPALTLFSPASTDSERSVYQFAESIVAETIESSSNATSTVIRKNMPLCLRGTDVFVL